MQPDRECSIATGFEGAHIVIMLQANGKLVEKCRDYIVKFAVEEAFLWTKQPQTVIITKASLAKRNAFIKDIHEMVRIYVSIEGILLCNEVDESNTILTFIAYLYAGLDIHHFLASVLL